VFSDFEIYIKLTYEILRILRSHEVNGTEQTDKIEAVSALNKQTKSRHILFE